MMEAPSESLKLRTYNVTAMDFTPEELFQEVRKLVPDLKVDYRPDGRQEIADSWPQVFDDSNARRDWGWKPTYDLAQILGKIAISFLLPETAQAKNKKRRL
ncbi:hypothetical protein MTO96_039513 [Rhipicephalus appendiculatus]